MLNNQRITRGAIILGKPPVLKKHGAHRKQHLEYLEYLEYLAFCKVWI
jgi:hypothetical protein